MNQLARLVAAVAACVVSVVGDASSTHASMVTLQNATATYSQQPPLSGSWLVSHAIDGDSISGGIESGWAVGRNNNVADDSALSEIAVFETAMDAGFAGTTELTFTLFQQLSVVPQHNIGRFRLSITTDDRAEFADGSPIGGDVTANWIVLTPTSTASTGGAILTILGDDSIQASGPNPSTSIYTIRALTNLTGITGFRLEVLEDPTLPKNGPGRAINGNFVLTEFTVDAVQSVPEPATIQILISAGIAMLLGAIWARVH